MNDLLQQLETDPWGRLILHQVMTVGWLNSFHFLLVAARLSGIFIVAPLVKATSIPFAARVGLVLLLSLVIAPSLSAIPSPHVDVAQILYQPPSNILLASVADIVCMMAIEIGLGSLLGIGLIAVFCGLKQGGLWLDRHSGLGMGAVMNPDWSAGETGCGSLVHIIGIAGFLLLEPLGGPLILIQSLVQTFHTIPIGTAAWSMSSVELLNGLVQHSLVLGLRVAMPVIATMMLVDVVLSLISRNNSLTMSSPFLAVRMGVSLAVLALTMSAIPDVIAGTLLSTLSLLSEFQ